MFVGNGQYEQVPRFEIRDLPRSEEELCVRLAAAGIFPDECEIQLKKPVKSRNLDSI